LKPLVLLLVKERRDAELAEVRQKVATSPMHVDQLASQLLMQQGDTARAEELVDQMITGHPEAFDAAVCRALAPMPVLVELCLPLVHVGGRLVAMKTAGEDVSGAFELLGGGVPEVIPAPTAAHEHGTVVVVPKVAPTPPAYPRRPGLPARRPLPA